MTELPGILQWSIAGWQRLQKRGRFVQPDSGKQLVTELEDLSSPIGAFVRDCCEVGQGNEIHVRDLYDRWKRWCEEKGRRETGTEQTFGRDLRTVVPGLDTRQPRTGETRVRVYIGVRLHPEEESIPE
jgi:putative DNA primase/helicase